MHLYLFYFIFIYFIIQQFNVIPHQPSIEYLRNFYLLIVERYRQTLDYFLNSTTKINKGKYL